MTAVASRNFRVGKVLSRSFHIFFRNFLKISLLTMIVMLPYWLFISYSGLFGFASIRNFYSMGVATTTFYTFRLTGLSYLIDALSQALIVFGAFQQMRGQRFRVGESLRRGVTRSLPVIGLAICVGVAEVVGFILLLVPGFVFVTMLYVALPACVVEKLSPFASMGRSAVLTKGNRWRVLGLYLLVLAVGFVVAQMLQWVSVALGNIAIGSVARFVWTRLAGAFASIVTVVVYYDLRIAEDGVDVERIAAVFE